MNIGEAIAACGLELEYPEGDLMVVRLENGHAVQRPLREVAHLDLVRDTHVSGGVFRNGRSRKADDLVSVKDIQFDADLADYLGWPKAELWTLAEDQLWPLIEAQRIDLEEVFSRAQVPATRLDYTGYGLCFHTYITDDDQGEIERIKLAHKGIVQRINEMAGKKMLDPQVSDSGSRVTRIPGCLNTKGEIHRLSKIIWMTGEIATLEQLEAVSGKSGQKQARITPISASKKLDQRVLDMLVEHVSPHWVLGQRHLLSLSLAGMLAKAGVQEEQALEIMERLSVDDNDKDDRANSVRDTYQRIEQGLDTRGFFGLKELLPEELTGWLDQELSGVRDASSRGVTVEFTAGGSQEAARRDFDDPPESAFSGWVGEYVDLVLPTTEAPKAFHLGIALTTLGAMMGRRVSMQYGSDRLYGNLFCVLVGKSNKTRKDTAIKRATLSLSTPMGAHGIHINHGIRIVKDVGSSTALIKDLQDRPNTLLYFTEFARLINNARRKGSESITDTLIEAFDTPSIMHNRSMTNPLEAVNPYLSLMAATQPDILSGLMTGDDMVSGFANRFLFICGNPTGPISMPRVLDEGDMKVLMHEFWRTRERYEEGASLSLSDEARELWDAWYINDWHREEPSAEAEALKQRMHTMIQKIALIYSVTDGLQEVPTEHVQRGIDIMDWAWRNLRRLSAAWGRSIDGQIEEKIVAALQQHGPLSRRDLQRKCSNRKWTGHDFSRMFDALLKNKEIVCDPVGMVWLAE